MVKKKASLALLPLTLCFSSLPVLAATTADLEKRLEQQEKQIKRLENRLKGTRAAVKENRSRLSDAADRLKINGFFSGGASVMDSENMALSLYGIDDNFSTASVSKLGIQMTFEVTDDVDVTGQLVSRGTKNYNVEAEWAYLSWEARSDLTIRVGRQRIPYYLLSEYLDVAYAYPWVRPPVEMYNIPISSTDGLGLLYDWTIGDVNFNLQMYAGAGEGFSDQLEATFELNQAWGGALFAEYDAWTFRLGYNTSNLDVTDVPLGGKGYLLGAGIDALNDGAAAVNAQLAGGGIPYVVPTIQNQINAEGVESVYTSAAFMYDDGKLLVMGEISNLKLEEENFAAPAGDGGYLTVGYRFGKWMPHATFAKYYTDSDNDAQVASTYGAVQDLLQGIHTGTYMAVLQGTGNPAIAEAQADAAVSILGNSGDPAQGAEDYANLMTLQNTLGSLTQQQQSYTLGVTYDFNPRVKVKLEASFYENFGNFHSVGEFDGDPVAAGAVLSGGSAYDVSSPVNVQKIKGNGRFEAPNGGDKNTAIYSFSIDAVF